MAHPAPLHAVPNSRVAATASLRLNRRATFAASLLLVALVFGLIAFTAWTQLEDRRRQLAIEFNARMDAVGTVIANARTLAFNVKGNANLFLSNRGTGNAPVAETSAVPGFTELTVRDSGTGHAIGSVLLTAEMNKASVRLKEQATLASFLIERMHVFRTGAAPFSYGNSYFLSGEGDLFALYPQQSMRLLVEQRADRSAQHLIADALRPLTAIVPAESEHRGEPAFTEPHADPTLPASNEGYVLGHHVTSVVYPVYFAHRMVGIVATDILSDAFTVALAPSISIPGVFLVVSQDRQVVASDQLPVDHGVLAPGTRLPDELLHLFESAGDRLALTGRNVAVKVPLRGTPWHLFYFAPATALLEGMAPTLIISALVLLTTIAALAWAHRLVNRRLHDEIEERLAVEKALRASEARLTDVADNFPGAIFQMRRDAGGTTSVPYVSKGVENILGVSADEIIRSPEERYRNVCDEDHDKLVASVESAYRELTLWSIEFRVNLADGVHWVAGRAHVHATEDGHVLANGFWLDVTTQHRQATELAAAVAQLKRDKAEQARLINKLEVAQNQLLQAEKLAAVGQLAAGVAHEINNPIGFVNSNLGALENYFNDLLRLAENCGRDAEPAERAKIDALREEIDYEFLKQDLPDVIRESREGLQRVTRIVQDLRDFSRIDSGETAIVELAECLENTINVLASEVRPRADLICDFGKAPPVECIPALINQVLLSIVRNAVQAIPAGRRGLITLRTGSDGPDIAWAEVEDNGIGMTAEIQGRIFEPFFTTKPVGQGSGLGLSTAYSIVKQHGGTIEVDSREGSGSRFRVTLPVKMVKEE